MTENITFPRPVTLTLRVLSIVAGVLLLGVILLTVADVVSRTARDRSILGTVDIATMLLVAIAFLGLASAEVEGRHVAVELFESRFGVRTRAVFSAIRALLLLGLGVLLVWGLTEVLASAATRGETTNTILRLPTWPAKLVLLVSFVAFFVVAIWKELLTVAALRAEQNGAHR
ncbi:TRAP transporter small permease [Mycobacterium sp. PS03-16]|uniref:TRAP transporter small permease subunit n=1 Tax=Mycobacterium sp. PS03-16 TaxID=2559611 RepID=UPI001074123A|nr:TRAP transporter small permease [Mycobacterium sp. PS03-16]TFV60277.1 TRAP transporter small permease [Mycobacterium sp. PS03-16]